jgi:hypothetical protein
MWAVWCFSPSLDPKADVHWKSEGQFQGQSGLAGEAGGRWAELPITEWTEKKNRLLSDSRPPVRPPGEPTQTEFMMADDLR